MSDRGAEDFGRAVALLRQAGIAFAPTFVAFAPWTTLEGYVDLLHRLTALIDSICAAAAGALVAPGLIF